MVARGVTAVVSTAYLDEAERFDRVALLHEGRVQAVDTPRALAAGFRGVLLDVHVAAPRAARPAIEAIPGVVRAHLFGDRLHVTIAAGDALEQLGRRLGEAGVRAESIRPIAPTLEDVFLARVAEAEREAA